MLMFRDEKNQKVIDRIKHHDIIMKKATKRLNEAPIKVSSGLKKKLVM